MERTQIANLTEQVRRYLESDDLEGAIALLEALRPADKAEVFGDLPPSRQQHLLPRLDAEESADILEKLEDEEVAELAGRLEPRTLGRILDAMEPDEAADLLGDLPTQKAQALLASMKEAEEVRPLLLHPDDTAGGLMTSEFLALKRKMSAREALEAVRRWAPETEAAHYLFVVDTRNKLCGVVSLRQLIIVDPTTRLEEIMDPDVIQVKVGTDREECAQIMSRYDITALPVVDEEERLLGVITIDDILDVLEEEATEDIQRLGGAQPLEKPYLSTGIFEVSKKRMGWLLVLFVTETLTGSVLRHFQTQLDAVVALAFFVPLLIGTGGNAGTQTTSTIIRALAVGEIEPRDLLRVFWHEVRTGALLGLAMALVAFIRALTWGTTPNLALAVATAIMIIVIWANSLGSLLPLIAYKLGIDPAVVSGPVMSTLVDATGLFIYLTIAGLMLGI